MDGAYESFVELARCEKEGRDYSLELENRGSDIAVIASHGGGIEQGTSEIAKAVAGEGLSYYCFNGVKRSGNRDLHIVSTQFDEPNGLALVIQSRVVIAIHGLQSEGHVTRVGGLDEELKGRLLEAFTDAGFEARRDRSHHSGTSPSNVCNRGVTGEGVQLEIPRGLRRMMFEGLDRKGRRFKKTPFHAFVGVVRGVLVSVRCVVGLNH